MFNRFIRDTRGVAAIEFALLALPFFLVVFFVIETSIVFIAEVTMDNAIKKVAREVRLGNPAALTQDEVRTIACPHVDVLFDCAKLSIDLRRYEKFDDMTLPPLMDHGRITPVFQAGDSNAVMTLRMAYEWPITTNLPQAYLSNLASGNHLIAAGTFFKSEPY